MSTRCIALLTLVLSLAGLAMKGRVERASRFQHYYATLHHEDPQLNAWQRVLVSLALTNTR
jgi:hypothetical protein